MLTLSGLGETVELTPRDGEIYRCREDDLVALGLMTIMER